MSPLARLPKAIAWIRSRPEFKHAGIVITGSLAAQVILLLSMPILSRLFQPADFGHQSLLLTVATIGGSVAALCYDTAVLLPHSKQTSAALYRLAIFISFIGGLVCLAGYFLFLELSKLVPTDGTLAINLALVYFGIVTTTVFNVFGAVLARASLYRPIAFSKFNNTAIPAVLQIGFGLAGFQTLGLQMGRVIGHIICTAQMARSLPSPFRLGSLLPPRWRTMVTAGRRYRGIILHVPRELLMRASVTLPPVMLLTFYGPIWAGFYFFSERLIERPGVMLSDSLNRLPMKVFAAHAREGLPILKLAVRYTIIVALLITPAVALVAVFGDWIFDVFFGRNWVPAADFAKVQAVLTAVRLTTLPASTLVVALRIPRQGLIVDSVFFLRVFSIPVAAWFGYDPLYAVAINAAIAIVYHLAIAGICLRAARRFDRGLAATTSPESR